MPRNQHNQLTYDPRQEPLTLTPQTIRRIFAEEDSADLIALYVFYYQTAKYYQEDQPVWATTSFTAKGCGKSPEWVRRVKARLIEMKLISEVHARQEMDAGERKRNVWGKRYILVNFMQNFNPPDSSTLEDLQSSGFFNPTGSSTVEESEGLKTFNPTGSSTVEESEGLKTFNPTDSSTVEDLQPLKIFNCRRIRTLNTYRKSKSIKYRTTTKKEVAFSPSIDIAKLIKPHRKKPEMQKKRIRVEYNSPLMSQIGSWFGRKETTRWSVYEAEALLEVDPVKDEIDLLERFYIANLPKEEDFRRHNISTLLNNWDGEMDKARKVLNCKVQLHTPQRRGNKIMT